MNRLELKNQFKFFDNYSIFLDQDLSINSFLRLDIFVKYTNITGLMDVVFLSNYLIDNNYAFTLDMEGDNYLVSEKSDIRCVLSMILKCILNQKNFKGKFYI